MTPLPASTVLPVRETPAGLEVLMVLRPPTGPFGGMWVFPGGKVDDVDRRAAVDGGGEADGDLTWRLAALRELAEEVGVFLTEPELVSPPVGVRGGEVYRAVASAGATLDARRLVYLSNWITPEGVPARFDTRFYAAPVPDGADAIPVDGEVVDLAWARPVDALARAEEGEWPMILPTVHHLRLLADHAHLHDLEEVAATEPDPVQPRMVTVGGRVEVLLPGDPGYEEAGS